MMPRMFWRVPTVDPTKQFLNGLRRPGFRLRIPVRALIRGLAFGLVLGSTIAGVRIAASDNVRTVRPGRVYRSAQMNPERLAEFIRERGIRTVINLRGHCPDFAWYRDECRITHDAGVSQEDITLSAIRLPSPTELRRLVEVLDHSEYPIVMHCRQGVDRTGLASVAVRLLEPGVTLNEAERQLGWVYGYVPYNGTQNMRRFVRLYRDWLDRLECAHQPELFRHWAMKEYCPGACRARVELMDCPAGQWPAKAARIIKMTIENSSVEAWRFRPGTRQGVHARYRVHRSDGMTIIEERAGLFDAVVQPGEAIVLDLGIPPLPPGKYGLHVDLIDVDDNAFSQFGFEPLVREFAVGP